MLRISLLISACAVIAGCAHGNLVGQQGNSLNANYSLQDRRAAKTHIRVTPTIPDGFVAMGDYSSERCHQYAQNEPPSDAVLLDDLVMLAYAEGADGVTNARFERESGLLRNCWLIAKGTATFYRAAR